MFFDINIFFDLKNETASFYCFANMTIFFDIFHGMALAN